jgi:hypothetical protein
MEKAKERFLTLHHSDYGKLKALLKSETFGSNEEILFIDTLEDEVKKVGTWLPMSLSRDRSSVVSRLRSSGVQSCLSSTTHVSVLDKKSSYLGHLNRTWLSLSRWN